MNIFKIKKIFLVFALSGLMVPSIHAWYVPGFSLFRSAVSGVLHHLWQHKVPYMLNAATLLILHSQIGILNEIIKRERCGSQFDNEWKSNILFQIADIRQALGGKEIIEGINYGRYSTYAVTVKNLGDNIDNTGRLGVLVGQVLSNQKKFNESTKAECKKNLENIESRLLSIETLIPERFSEVQERLTALENKLNKEIVVKADE